MMMFCGSPSERFVQRVHSTYIHAPALQDMIEQTSAWMKMSLNPRRCGTNVAIVGRGRWLIHNHLASGEVGFDSADRDRCLRMILGVDERFKYDIITKEDWISRRLVTDRFRNERIFVCGDAAHLWIPYAGFGMNAGIADAVDFCWLLASVLQGWAKPGMLDAYEAERQPITEQVSRFAMDHALAVMGQKRSVPPEVELDGRDGDAARERVGRVAYDLKVQQQDCCAGLNFGCYYDSSPIIVHDGEVPPPYTDGQFYTLDITGGQGSAFMAPKRALSP